MRIPGPSSLLSAAETVKDGVTDLVLDIPGTVGQVLDLLSRTGELVERADALLTRAEEVLERSESAVRAAETMVAESDELLARTGRVLAEAESAMGGAGDLLARGDALIEPLEDLSDKLMPVAERVTASVDPDEVEAVIGMVNHLPALLAHLEDDIMPLLDTMGEVGPNVRGILDDVDGLTTALAGVPGIEFLQRRGERKEREGRGVSYAQAQLDSEGQHAAPTSPRAITSER